MIIRWFSSNYNILNYDFEVRSQFFSLVNNVYRAPLGGENGGVNQWLNKLSQYCVSTTRPQGGSIAVPFHKFHCGGSFA